MTLESIFKALHQTYGAQNWWPADSPFEIMVGAILVQNTAWTNVEQAIANLKRNKSLDAQIIVSTTSKNLAIWLKPSGYFNIKAKRLQNYCRWYLDKGGHRRLSRWNTKWLRRQLLSINGVGPETADEILLYAFDRPVFVIDSYTRRLFSRLGLIEPDSGYEDIRSYFESGLPADSKTFNEYHALIVKHAKDVCCKRPKCGDCCLRNQCQTNLSLK